MADFACPFGCGTHKFPRDCRAVDSGMTPAEYDTMMQTLQRAKRDAESDAKYAAASTSGRLGGSFLGQPIDPGDLTLAQASRMLKSAKQKAEDEKLTMLMYGSPATGKTMHSLVGRPGQSMSVRTIQAFDNNGKSLALRWDEPSSSWVEVASVTCGGCDADVPEYEVAGTGTYRGKPVCVDCNELFEEQGSSVPRFHALAPCGGCSTLVPSEDLAPRAVVDKKTGRVKQLASYCRACRTGAP
jgi:hypothetical protein